MDFTKREQIAILIMVLVIILSFGVKSILGSFSKPKEGSMEVYESYEIYEGEEEEFGKEELSEKEELIIVHIAGQVYYPGVVQTNTGKRVIDAIELCGGLKEDADLSRINLAKKLVDEEKVYIPKIGEEVPEDIIEISGNSETKNPMININTSSKADLMTLPGIGEKLAGNIIEYRENNNFKKIEDIKNVPGIGEKKFESISNLITIK